MSAETRRGREAMLERGDEQDQERMKCVPVENEMEMERTSR